MYLLKYNTNVSIAFFLPDENDPWNGLDGMQDSITVEYYRPGMDGQFTTMNSPSIIGAGNGWYRLEIPEEILALGMLVLRFTAPGAKPQQQIYQVVAFDPYDSAGLGLSRIDVAIGTRSTLDQVGVQAALTSHGYTSARAGYLDRLDTTVSSRMPAGNVTVGGYASGQDPATLVWGASSRTLTQLGNSLVDEIWHRVRSASNPPSGSFGDYIDAKVSSGASDRSPAEKEQIRYVLGIDGTKSAPTGNEGYIPQIYSKVNPLQFTAGNVHALINAYSTGLDPATMVWGASTRTITQLGDNLVDEIWNRLRNAVPRPTGSFGDLLDTKVSSVQSQPTWTDEEKQQIRYRLSIDGAQSAPSTTTGTMHSINSKVTPLQFENNNVLAKVMGYGSGESPADHVLINPQNKVATDSNGHVTVSTNLDKTNYTLSSADKDELVDRVWDEPKSQHNVSNSFGDYLDTKVSSRHPNTSVTVGGYHTGKDPGSMVWGFSQRTLTSVLNVVSGSSTTIADQIWNRLRSDDIRPNGSFGYYLDEQISVLRDTGASDWTTEEREQIRYVLGIDGDKSAPSGSTGWIPDIRSKTQQLQFTNNNVHVVVASYFNGMSPAEQVLMNAANKILANSSGHVTVATNNDKTGYSLSSTSINQIVDGVWDEPKSDHSAANTFGDYLDTKVSSRHPDASVTVGGYDTGQSPAEQILLNGNKLHTNSSGHVVSYSVLDKSGYSLSASERIQLAGAVWEEPKSAHTTPNSFGDYLDTKVSSRHPNTAVTVGGYAGGQSPADMVLTNPANKLSTTSAGGVLVGGYESGMSPAELLLMDASRKLFLTNDGSVRVGGYASGQTPADHVLSNPTAKLNTNALGEVTVAVNKDKTNYGLSNSERQSIASAIWNFVVEGSHTVVHLLRMISSVLLGKRIVSGNTFRYRDAADTKDRVVGQVDSNRNREIITLDGD